MLARLLGAALLVAAAASLARTFGFSWTFRAADEPGWVAAPVLGLGVGILVGLTSIGAGSLLMAGLALLYGLAASRSVGVDVVHGALLAAVAAVAHGLDGRVQFDLLLPLLLGSLPGVVIGSLLCGRVPSRPLRLAVATLLVLTALRLF